MRKIALLIVLCICVSILNNIFCVSANVNVNSKEYSEAFLENQAESVKAYNELLLKFTCIDESEQTVTELAAAKINDEKEIYPDYYGGAYVDEKTGELIVLLTETSTANCNEISSMSSQSSQITYKNCDISFNKMCEVIELITEGIGVLKEKGVIISSIRDDIMNGKVIVSLIGLDEEKKNIVEEYSNCDFLEFEEAEVNTNATTLGGGYLVTGNLGKRATIGFAATRNGVSGYVTAGHLSMYNGMAVTYEGTSIGTVEESSFYNGSSADAAFIKANTNFTPSNLLPTGYTIWAASTWTLPVNTVVYMYGGQSGGLVSGKISSTNSSVQFEDELILTKLWVADYESVGGDSGSPIMFYDGNFSGNLKYTLYGIHTGSASDGSASYISSYKNIVEELGVSAIVE